MSEIEKMILAVMISQELLKRDQKILAIKIVRFMYGCNIVDSKRFVDRLQKDKKETSTCNNYKDLLDACECARNRLEQLENDGFESGQVDAGGQITTLEHLEAVIAKAKP